MQLIDVGMTAMVVSEARHLAKLGDLIGRNADAKDLRSHADKLTASLAVYNWANDSDVFANRYPDGGKFYRRISPTSFYPLMAKAATDEQAAAMVQKWLLDPTHFAITTAGDHVGNSDDNYWGLPSIDARDPAFPKLGYWRGFVWVCHVVALVFTLMTYMVLS
jgi:putative isomerase